MFRVGLVFCLFLAACSGPANGPGRGAGSSASNAGQLGTSKSSAADNASGIAAATGGTKTKAVGLRPSYSACVEHADAVIPATQACIEEETGYQEARLHDVLDALKRARPDQVAATQYAQSAWQADTDSKCAWDAATEGQQQRIEANMCSLEAISKRADELSR